MNKDFVPFDVAFELKELGFDESCLGYWIDEEPKNPEGQCLVLYKKPWDDEKITKSVIERYCWAPTFSQVFRWFREMYNWQHSIEPTSDQHIRQLGYNYWIWNYKTGEEYYTEPKNRPSGDWEYEIYEQAELACVKKLIEIVKK